MPPRAGQVPGSGDSNVAACASAAQHAAHLVDLRLCGVQDLQALLRAGIAEYALEGTDLGQRRQPRKLMLAQALVHLGDDQ